MVNQGAITKRIFSFADHLVGHFIGGSIQMYWPALFCRDEWKCNQHRGDWEQLSCRP